MKTCQEDYLTKLIAYKKVKVTKIGNIFGFIAFIISAIICGIVFAANIMH
jgi:hypothetical protein